MSAGEKWSDDEHALMLRVYRSRGGIKVVAKATGRSVRAIQRKAQDMGLTRKEHPWTPEEDALVVELWPTMGIACSIHFPLRTPGAVRQRAVKFRVARLHKSAAPEPIRVVHIPRVSSVFDLARSMT